MFIAKQISTYDVSIDLTGLKPGQHEVDIKYNQASTNLEYMVNPSTVNVTISDKVSTVKKDQLKEFFSNSWIKIIQ